MKKGAGRRAQGAENGEPVPEGPAPRPLRPALFVLLAVFALGAVAIFLYLRRDRDPDIILVTIDTLRADHATTPFLTELAKQGVSFPNAHAHNVMTLPSHTNILTGLLPYQHGVRDNAGFTFGAQKGPVAASKKQTTVAAALRARGYATGAFVAAYPLDSHFGLDADFDVYDDAYHKDPNASQFATPERPATEVLAAAQQFYDAHADRKKFLWVHLYEPHHPYAGSYRAEVERVDDALRTFLRPILARKPETLLIVTADHGESLGEHEEEHHGLFAYEGALRVPLFVIERGRIEPRVDPAFVRHIDIVPTILARLGLEQPAELQGASLLDIRGPRDTYFEALWGTLNLGWAPLVGMIHEGHKYIELPLAELYDLSRDPQERTNILTQNRKMTTRIRERLASAAPASATAERNVTPDEAKNLMSLGYLTGTAAAKKRYTALDDPKTLVRFHQRMNAALELHRQGRSPEAIAAARQLVADRPEMQMAKDLLATLLERTENTAEAEALLRTSTDAAAKKRLGLLLSERGDAAEAVAILGEFAGGDDPQLLNAYGIALADTGRVRDAVAQFQRVLALDANNAVAHQNLGIVALRVNRIEESRQSLARALQLNASLPRAWNAMGVVHARRNEVDQAMQAWQRAVSLDAKQYDALFNLGMVAGRAGRREEARRALTQFVETAPAKRYAKDIGAAKQALASLR
jgi:arylsulfatase A-like enzyme/tetratricopeptide (TPR) repeat protein